MSACRRTVRTTSRLRAFTLVELMLVLALAAAFLVAASELVVWGLRIVRAWQQREELRGQLSSVMDRWTRDAVAADNVDLAQDGEFKFDTPAVDNVDYTYASTSMTRDDSATTQQTVLRYITSLDFNYFNSSGMQLSTPVASGSLSSIRVVQLVATVSRNNETISMAAAACLRNM